MYETVPQAVGLLSYYGQFMPLFFFDYDNGDDFVVDRVGTTLPNIDAARIEASQTMAELAADTLPGLQQAALGIVVRDEHGYVKLRVRLDYFVEAAPI